MRRTGILAAMVMVLLTSQASVAAVFYSLDRSFNPNPRITSFTSDPLDASVSVVGSLSSLGSVHSACMKMSRDGRLFLAPYGQTIYELDPSTGGILGSLSVGSSYIEGLAASESGLLYASVGDGGAIRKVDFDQGMVTSLISGYPSDIDDLDFDADGNLIGTDINQSGNVYRIPLDGSAPVFLTTLPAIHVGPMTFSSEDSAFYFVSAEVSVGGRQLWRLSWANGMPVGVGHYVKDISASGEYVGLAAVPEPSTGLLLSAAGVVALYRRRAK